MSINKETIVTNELRRFAMRKLAKGELVLFAKAIANKLPLPSAGVAVDRLYLLNHMRVIENSIYRVTEYAHISNDDAAIIKDCVARFLQWRSAVAAGTASVIFTSGSEGVIDDLSSLPRYFDTCLLCSIADIQGSPDRLYATFTDVVNEQLGISTALA